MRRVLKILLVTTLLAGVGVSVYFRDLFFNDNLHTVVENQVYRSGQMDPDDLPGVVETYGIKVIINLRGEPGADSLLLWARTVYAFKIYRAEVCLEGEAVAAGGVFPLCGYVPWPASEIFDDRRVPGEPEEQSTRTRVKETRPRNSSFGGEPPAVARV